MHTKTLIILYPGCVIYEIVTAIELLYEHYPIEIANIDKDLHVANNGLKIETDLSYKDVNINKYKSIIIPGGDVQSILHNEELDIIIQKAASNDDICIGGICNGAWLIAKSGILNNKRCTHTLHPLYAEEDLLEIARPYFKGTIYCSDDVVVDGRIVTAKPWAHIDFAVTLCELVNIYDKNKAIKVGEYLKGIYQPK